MSLPRLLPALVAFVGLLPIAHAQEAPAPELGPDEVVAAQLAGFAQGDDEGIARAFAFASPGNRANTGPLPRFTRMIREAYPELIGHRGAELAPLRKDDSHAYQGVEIVGPDGRDHLYLFVLSRYAHEDCDGCWMTDGVSKRPADPDAKAL
jgi:hypothetical protein